MVLTTWNLQGSEGVPVPTVAEHLRGVGSDLVALQEVQRGQARAIASALGARSCHWSFKHRALTNGSEGHALLGVTRGLRSITSRAVSHRRRPWSWRRRIIQVAHLDQHSSPGYPLPVSTLVNLHLMPHPDGAGDRRRELADVLAELDEVAGPDGGAGAAPDRVLLGDFNAVPDDPVFEPLTEAGYRAVETGPTNWRGRPSDRPPEQRLDYIWLGSGLRGEVVSTPEPGDPGFAEFPRISDHLPVSARIHADRDES